MLRGPQKWLKKDGVLRSAYLVRFAAVADSAHEKRHVWSHIGKTSCSTDLKDLCCVRRCHGGQTDAKQGTCPCLREGRLSKTASDRSVEEAN
jgi:hypothetical protein